MLLRTKMHIWQFCKELDYNFMNLSIPRLLYWGGCIDKPWRFQNYNKVLPTNTNYMNSERKKIPFKILFSKLPISKPILKATKAAIFAHKLHVQLRWHFIFPSPPSHNPGGSQASGSSLYLPCSDSLIFTPSPATAPLAALELGPGVNMCQIQLILPFYHIL